MSVYLLDNPIQPYAWGSRTAIATLFGWPTPEGPQAELWMGAHPRAPSRVSGGKSLGEVIAADPPGVLGHPVAEAFGAQLPFLFKVLAAETPLSIQAHPSLAQAQAGFADEERRGVPRDAAHRNFKDPNHKPELLVALTPFDALLGFRPVKETLELLRALNEPALLPLVKALSGADEEQALRDAFSWAMTRSPSELAKTVALTAAACARTAASAGRYQASCEWAARAARLYPGDGGVIASLLLNHLRLTPGEGIYLGAQVLHAYLQGTGLELMANSDNVLRAGLTPKHIDVPKLLEVAQFRPTAATPLRPTQVDAHEALYDTPAREFRLSRLRVGGGAPVRRSDRVGAELLLCLTGKATVSSESTQVSLAPGGCAFIEGTAPYELAGEAEVYRAAVPR